MAWIKPSTELSNKSFLLLPHPSKAKWSDRDKGYEKVGTKFALLTIWITHWMYKWRNPRCKNGILPPGSMGFPLIGETIELIIPSYSLDLQPFIKKRIQSSSGKITEKFNTFLEGLMCLPLNIPGTKYHRCLKDKDEIIKLLKDSLKERHASTAEARKGDFLDHAINDINTHKFLSEDLIVHLMFGALFASFESIATALTLAFKFLSDHPSALQELTAEHEVLLKNRKNMDTSLTWDEYKSMTFTSQVINETLRLGNLMPGWLRKALKDVQVNGYTIPAGWTIMVVPAALQLNPNTFEDPLAFNPWRWKDLGPDVISNNFMPFGGGMRQCAGADYSKVFMAAFFHVLVTKYRWTKVKGGDVFRNPILGFGEAIHINFSRIA
ncbi:hypothetical protein L1049_014628 [Liquidambar formosana]|uniref:Cytochrome P450 n=1 Tax=Liquidambar formosana TaxID=63359 RepID=A0AAP0RWV2_LIQFO